MPNNMQDAGVSLKVDGLAQFRQGMREAAGAMGVLASESALADSELRKTGDTQAYVQSKVSVLTRQIETQRKAVETARQALAEAAAAYGENSRQAQQWQTKLNQAQARLNGFEASLQQVQTGTDRMQTSVKGAGAATQQLGRIADATRFTAFKSALDSVDKKISAVANTARRLASGVWGMGTEAAKWADDLATNASRYGIDTKTLQQWQYASNFVDVSVETIAGASNRLLAAMRSDSEALQGLGVNFRGAGGQLLATQDVFWDTIDALGRMTNETERDSAAQQIFGKSFADLKPLIDAGREAFEGFCAEAERAGVVLSDDQVRGLTSFSDSLDRLSASGQALKYGLMADLAPAFEAISDTAGEAVQQILEWTKSEEGQAAIRGLADAVKDLVESFANGGLQSLIQGVTDAVKGLSEAAQSLGGSGLFDLIKAGGITIGAGKVVSGGIRTANAAKNLLGLGAGAAAKGGATALASGAATTGTAGSAAVGGGMLGTLGTGLAGFGLGMASVLGVGALIKGMAGPRQEIGADYRADTRARQTYEQAQERHNRDIMRQIQMTTDSVTQAIAEIEDDVDWRTRANREKMAGLTQDDITKAIDAASLQFGGDDKDDQGPQEVKGEITLAVEGTREAVQAALHDGVVEAHEIEGIQAYIDEVFNPAVDEAVKLIAGGWQRIYGRASRGPTESDRKAAEANMPKTERQVLEFSAMTQWVKANLDIENAEETARLLWVDLVTAAGSPEGVNADLSMSYDDAKASGSNQTFNAMYIWAKRVCGGDEERAEELVRDLWNQMGTYAQMQSPELDGEWHGTATSSTVFQQAAKQIFQGDLGAAITLIEGWMDDLVLTAANYSPRMMPRKEGEVLQYAVMTKWVEDHMGKDAAKAKGAAADLWNTLVAAAGDPDALGVVLASQTGEEAAADKDNDTFTALRDWVAEVLGLDEAAAEVAAKALWDELATYSSTYEPTLATEYTGTGTSQVFQDAVAKIYGTDYETAKATLEGYLTDLNTLAATGVKAPETQGEEGAADGVNGQTTAIGGSSFLTDRVEELTKVRDEIQLLVDYIAEHTGEVIDDTVIKRLEECLGRAERLSGDIDWYNSDEAVQGRGAVAMAMEGMDWEQSFATGTAYAKALRKHELEGIQADINAARGAMGDANTERLLARGRVEDLRVAGATQAEIDEAQAAADAAQAAFEAAQAEYERISGAAPERIAAVEKEYTDTIAEMMAGAAKLLGYGGQGKVTFTAPGVVPQELLDADRSHQIARNWSNPYLPGSEMHNNLNSMLLSMSPDMKAMADRLAGFGSWEVFKRAYPTEAGIIESAGSAQNSAAADFWNTIAFSAFGKTFDGWATNSTVANNSFQNESFFQQLRETLGMNLPDDTESRATADTEASIAATRTALQELAAAMNAASGYDDFKALVNVAAQAGVFKGMDFSDTDGGPLETALADLAAEAQARGEEVGDLYGTGLTRKIGEVIDQTTLSGEEAGTGLAAGAESQEGAAAAAGAGLGDAMADGLREALDEHSPSRVMMRIGEYAGVGFAQGIAASIAQVQQVMRGLENTTGEGFGRAARGGNNYSSSSAVYVGNYYQNSAEDVNYISQQLAYMQRQQQLGYGHGRG